MKSPQKDPAAIVVPFGKHKGATVAELLAKDPQYADWVMAQGWVAERFAELHAAIATRGAGTDDTPEHNALQARFLDAGFRSAALTLSAGLKIAEAMRHNIDWLKECRQRDLKEVEVEIEKYSGWGSHQHSAAASLEKAKLKLPFVHQAAASDQFPITLRHAPEFEKRGVDVVIRWWFEFEGSRYGGPDETVGIELKPTFGDDYPTIMRQMKRLGCFVCVAGQYTGRGVSEVQLRQMFEANGQILIFVQEIEEEARKLA